MQLEPDLVIVFHGINDLKARFIWPPAAYRSDNTGLRAGDVDQLVMPGILEYSTVLRALMIDAGAIHPHLDMRTSLGRAQPTYFADEFGLQKRQGRYPDGIFEEVSAAEMLATNTDRYFRTNIENLVSLASSSGIEVLLASFTHWTESRSPVSTSEEYLAGIAQKNTTLREIASGAGTHWFDYAEAFPQDGRYYADGVHLNAEGARVKAELFARHLIESGLIPR